MISLRLGCQVIADILREFQRFCMYLGLMRIRIAHHIAIHIAARCYGVHETGVDLLNRLLQLRFDHTVKLERLPCRQFKCVIAVGCRQSIHVKPLRRGAHPAGNPHPNHETVGRFLFRLAPLTA